jgi:fucokinase
LKTLRSILTKGFRYSIDGLRWQVNAGGVVEAQAPVRVDLAGGWTDTPPQTCERGGAVVNIALLVDGKRPISATVERLNEPIVELIAADLGSCVRITDRALLSQHSDPKSPFGVHLSALQLLGLFSGMALRRRLEHLGGGLRITTHSEIPKGSGLGASSILGATLLAALSGAFGLRQGPEELCLAVLRLEQLMGTGGGWQDQVGGIWAGAKFASSKPGMGQCPEVEVLELSPEVRRGLNERMVLFYTGETRLAKDVLERVVGNYLVGRPETMDALDAMPHAVERARSALVHAEWKQLGECVSHSRQLNQRIEPTSTNPKLEGLFTTIEPDVYGAKLAGAGGGGFLFALAHDSDARARLYVKLRAMPAPAQVFEATLDVEGLQVRRTDG